MNTQAKFAAALLDPACPCPSGLKTWTGGDPARRFQVYRNNVVASLIDALADTFPVTLELVGDAFFRAMAGVFVRGCPPRSPILAFYGDDFPDFIGSFPPAAGLAYLADVARLEYLRVRAFHAADSMPIGAAELAGVLADESALPGLRLRVHPSLSVLHSRSAVVSLWAAHQGIGSLAQIVPSEPETALVLRHGLEVDVIEVSPAAGECIAAIVEGLPLGAAVARASSIDEAFDPAGVLGLLLQKSAITALIPSRRES